MLRLQQRGRHWHFSALLRLWHADVVSITLRQAGATLADSMRLIPFDSCESRVADAFHHQRPTTEAEAGLDKLMALEYGMDRDQYSVTMQYLTSKGILMPSQPIAEVFGYKLDDFSVEAQRHRRHRLCPFDNKVSNCTKDKVKGLVRL